MVIKFYLFTLFGFIAGFVIAFTWPTAMCSAVGVTEKGPVKGSWFGWIQKNENVSKENMAWV